MAERISAEHIFQFLQRKGFFEEHQTSQDAVRKLLGLPLPQETPRKRSGRVLKIFVDGSADLTRKQAGIGGVFYLDGEEIYTFSENRPGLTNNEAEYDALIHALELAVQFEVDGVEVSSDSELMVNQIQGSYRVKNARLKPRYDRVMELKTNAPSFKIQHVYRTNNKRADQLARDGMKSGVQQI